MLIMEANVDTIFCDLGSDCTLYNNYVVFLSPPSERSEWRRLCVRTMLCVCVSVCVFLRSGLVGVKC